MTDRERARAEHALVSRLFKTAQGLPPDEQEAFLDRELPEGGELRDRVRRMLGHDLKGGPLDRSMLPDRARQQAVAASDGSFEHRPGPARAPEAIAGHRIIRCLGRGGMGVVYEAEQDTPRRRVALKVLRQSLPDDATVRRFVREIELLGRLRHRGIAQVHGAGWTAAGEQGDTSQPWFSMELVDGLPLDEHCATHELSVPERLALVARIADALHHAHEQGVIHRDLKPANILVDREGQPRLLDFGVAGLASSARDEATRLTSTGMLIGTLAYMAPEQVSGRTSDTGPATDVYALGVLLHELLTGRPPLDIEGLSFPEAARLISEVSPRSLATVSTDLQGDIDTIVSKALSKEPERRYASAAALAADIRRHLAHEPLLARPPSTWYQVSKFARRHRTLVGGVTATLLASLIGMGVAIHLAVQARRGERAAVEAAYRAQVVAAASALANRQGSSLRRYLEDSPAGLRGFEWQYLHAASDSSWRHVTLPEAARPRSLGEHHVDFVTVEGDRALRHDWSTGRTSEIGYRDPDAGEVLAVADGQELLVAGLSFAPGSPPPMLVDLETGEPVTEIRRCGDGSRGSRFADVHGDLALELGGSELRWAGACDWRRGELSWRTTHCRFRHAGLSPDGGSMWMRCDPGHLRVHDFQSGELIGDVTDATLGETLAGVTVNADQSQLHVSTFEGSLRTWSLPEGELLFEVTGLPARQVSLSHDPIGDRLTTVGADDRITVWEAGLSAPRQLLGHDSRVLGSLLEGDRLVTADAGGVLREWDLGVALPGALRGHESFVYGVSCSPDGRLLASVSWDGSARLWSLATGALQQVLRPDGKHSNLKSVAFSPDGRYLAVEGDTGVWPRRVDLFDLHLGEQVTSSEPIRNATQREDLARITHHPRGWLIGQRQRLTFLEHRSLMPLGRVGELAGPFVVMSDQRRIIAAEDFTRLVVFDLDADRVAQVLESDHGPFKVIALGPDDDLVATGGTQVRVYDLASSSILHEIPGRGSRTLSLAFSPDGMRLACGDNDGGIRLFDTASWVELVRLEGHRGHVMSLVFSPDGRDLISASTDRTVRIWSTRSTAERVRAWSEGELGALP
ncbi:MAG: protein kinase [Acidobacteriota bacterium]